MPSPDRVSNRVMAKQPPEKRPPKIDPTVVTVHRPHSKSSSPEKGLGNGMIAFLIGGGLFAGLLGFGSVITSTCKPGNPDYEKGTGLCSSLNRQSEKEKAEEERRQAEEARTRSEEEQASAERAEKERIRLETAWIPTGFKVSDLNPNVAYRWVENPECGYSGCSQIELVPKDGCGSLYIKASLVDSAGRNVGYTNDLTSGVGPGQRALMTMRITNEERVTVMPNEIKCY